MKNLAIYAVHPIMYQTPIFKEFNEYIKEVGIDIHLKVLFGDDLSLRETYFKEINTHYKPNVPFLLNGYEYKFLKNLVYLKLCIKKDNHNKKIWP